MKGIFLYSINTIYTTETMSLIDTISRSFLPDQTEKVLQYHTPSFTLMP